MLLNRLILGSGKNVVKLEDQVYNDIFVDIKPFPGVDIVHDLNIIPWPFRRITGYDEISAIHVVEHLNSLVDFMDQCHQILKPGGSLYLETPCAGMDPDLEFADPTHVRCYRKHSFINYFTTAGIAQFGYTDKAWAVMHLEVVNNSIVFHGQPIKSQL